MGLAVVVVVAGMVVVVAGMVMMVEGCDRWWLGGGGQECLASSVSKLLHANNQGWVKKERSLFIGPMSQMVIYAHLSNLRFFVAFTRF